ncbi:hypothetical protein BH10BAC2_BH10BAC2_47230 [soil metagenome]
MKNLGGKMKKYIIGLAVILLITCAAFYKPIKSIFQEKPVNKNIAFTIYKGANYSSKVYDGTSVQIHIIVEKVRGSKSTVVWDKTFDEKLLKQYPSLENAITQQINIADVFEKKEQLVVRYYLTYNSKGSELQMQDALVVEDSAKLSSVAAGNKLCLVL